MVRARPSPSSFRVEEACTAAEAVGAVLEVESLHSTTETGREVL